MATTLTRAPTPPAATEAAAREGSAHVVPPSVRLWPLTALVLVSLGGCSLLVVVRMVMAANEAVLEANPTLNPLDPKVWWLPPEVFGNLSSLQLPLLGLTALALMAWSWRAHRALDAWGHRPAIARHLLLWPWFVPLLQFWWPYRGVAALHNEALALGGLSRWRRWANAVWWFAWLGAFVGALALDGLQRLEVAVLATSHGRLIGHAALGGLLLFAAVALMFIVEDVQRAVTRARRAAT